MDLDQFLEKFGVSVAALVALSWAIWRTARWTGQNVLLPTVTATIAFLKALQENVEKHTRSLEQLQASLPRICKYDGCQYQPPSEKPE